VTDNDTPLVPRGIVRDIILLHHPVDDIVWGAARISRPVDGRGADSALIEFFGRRGARPGYTVYWYSGAKRAKRALDGLVDPRIDTDYRPVTWPIQFYGMTNWIAGLGTREADSQTDDRLALELNPNEVRWNCPGCGVAGGELHLPTCKCPLCGSAYFEAHLSRCRGRSAIPSSFVWNPPPDTGGWEPPLAPEDIVTAPLEGVCRSCGLRGTIHKTGCPAAVAAARARLRGSPHEFSRSMASLRFEPPSCTLCGLGAQAEVHQPPRPPRQSIEPPDPPPPLTLTVDPPPDPPAPPAPDPPPPEPPEAIDPPARPSFNPVLLPMRERRPRNT
jgi:hypothetical protein